MENTIRESQRHSFETSELYVESFYSVADLLYLGMVHPDYIVGLLDDPDFPLENLYTNTIGKVLYRKLEP